MPKNSASILTSAILLFLIIAAAVNVRLYSLEKNELILEGDESIVALMAKHILEKKSAPVFVYGQDYMGSFEAYTVSILFSVFGQSVKTVKTAPLLYSLIAAVFLLVLLKKEFGATAAVLSVLLYAVPPYLLVKWSLSPTGGHIENLLFSIIILLFVYKYFSSENIIYIPVISFLSGLAFWINPFSIFLTVPFAVILFFSLKKNIKKLILIIFLFVIFFCAGSLPLIIYNIKNNGITFLKLGGFFLGVSGSAYKPGTNIIQLFFAKLFSMVIIFPKGLFFLMRNIIQNLGNFYFDGVVYLAGMIYFAISEIKSKNKFYLTLIAYFLLITLVFSVSSRSNRDRYLIIYYPIIFWSAAYVLKKFIVCCQNRKSVFCVAMTAAFFFLILTGNAYEIIKNNKSEEIAGFYDKIRITSDYLKSNQIKYVFADMYIAYPLIFLTGEEIICSPYAGFYNEDRIKAYTESVLANRGSTYIFLNNSWSEQMIENKLKSLKKNYVKHNVYDYGIITLQDYISPDSLDLPKRFKKRK
ncbi:MAG TPA: glycosyltransferase family 39 protein [bacterium]|nr:glycosyltransferase family 39 protein [bacterium]